MKEAIREHYSRVARGGSSCCCGEAAKETEATIQADPDALAREMGYGDDELAGLPEGANLGLGCGNPVALAGLKEGETVVDLGSGAGFDAFLCARKVGPDGWIYGVDVNDDMLAKARSNAARGGFANVEFLKGEIEHLPLPDAAADVVISNCVINLVPDKQSAYDEAFRVLKPGGRLEVSDVVAMRELSDEVRGNLSLISCCIGGAATVDAIKIMLERAGFEDIRIEPKDNSAEMIGKWGLDKEVRRAVISAYIRARKPRG